MSLVAFSIGKAMICSNKRGNVLLPDLLAVGDLEIQLGTVFNGIFAKEKEIGSHKYST